MTHSINNVELLNIAEAVAREKSIDKAIVLEAMASAIQKAAKSRYGQDVNIRVDIDPRTGDIEIYRLLEVVEDISEYSTQILLSDAKLKEPNAKIGDFIEEILPPLEFGRIAAQSAKQIIVSRVREAERDKQYEEYKDKIETIVSGTVRRIEYNNVIVDLGRGEAVIRRNELIPNENFRYGDRVRAYIYDVRREARGSQIFLSRTHPQFLAKLFAMEVPEIYDGIIEIKAVARDPGSRAKIAVISNDSSIDPVGACVGMRGSRVKAVTAELQGEKVDIIPWTADEATFVVNALQPVNVTKVILDETSRSLDVVVSDDQLSLAIGRRGQNVRLASQLTGWDINILTEQQEAEHRQNEFNKISQNFIKALDVDEIIAQALTVESFTTVEELAYVDLSEIAAIEGFDEDTAREIQNRAKESLAAQEKKIKSELEQLGVKDELYNLPYVTSSILLTVGRDGVKTIEDFAGYAVDDLCGWREKTDDGYKLTEGVLKDYNITRQQASQMILAARQAVGWVSEEELEDEGEEHLENEALDLSSN